MAADSMKQSHGKYITKEKTVKYISKFMSSSAKAGLNKILKEGHLWLVSNYHVRILSLVLLLEGDCFME